MTNMMNCLFKVFSTKIFASNSIRSIRFSVGESTDITFGLELEIMEISNESAKKQKLLGRQLYTEHCPEKSHKLWMKLISS